MQKQTKIRKSRAMNHKEERNMKRLINAALERHDAADLFKLFYNCLNSEETEEVRKAITEIMTEGNCIVVKADSMDDKTKIENFITQEVYRSYNEQQANLFLYY